MDKYKCRYCGEVLAKAEAKGQSAKYIQQLVENHEKICDENPRVKDD